MKSMKIKKNQNPQKLNKTRNVKIETLKTKKRHKEIFILLTLAAVQFTHIVDFMIVMPLSDLLMRIFVINPNEFSNLVATYTFSAGISSFFGAFWVDRFDRRNVIISIFIGFLLGNFACAFANNYTFFLLARVLTGIFGGMLNTIVSSIVADLIPYERRGRAMGVVMASFSLASVLGVPIGFYLAQKINWHAPFFMLTIFSFIILALILFVIPSIKLHLTHNYKPKIREILINIFAFKNQRTSLLFTFLILLGQFSIIPFITPFMVRNIGFTNDNVNSLYLLGGLITIFTTPLLGKISDKIGKHKVFTICSFLLLIPVIVITHLTSVPLYVALFFTSLMFIFTSGRIGPAMALVSGSVPAKNRGSFMSFNSSIMQLGSSIGVMISGFIVIDVNNKLQNYNFVGYFAFLIILLTIYISRKIKHNESN